MKFELYFIFMFARYLRKPGILSYIFKYKLLRQNWVSNSTYISNFYFILFLQCRDFPGLALPFLFQTHSCW